MPRMEHDNIYYWNIHNFLFPLIILTLKSEWTTYYFDLLCLCAWLSREIHNCPWQTLTLYSAKDMVLTLMHGSLRISLRYLWHIQLIYLWLWENKVMRRWGSPVKVYMMRTSIQSDIQVPKGSSILIKKQVYRHLPITVICQLQTSANHCYLYTISAILLQDNKMKDKCERCTQWGLYKILITWSQCFKLSYPYVI